VIDASRTTRKSKFQNRDVWVLVAIANRRGARNTWNRIVGESTGALRWAMRKESIGC